METYHAGHNDLYVLLSRSVAQAYNVVQVAGWREEVLGN